MWNETHLREMNGAALMRGESLGPPVPPRDIDRYPHSIIIDFRRLQLPTLKKYCAKYELDSISSLPATELACLVAKHFQQDLQVKEDFVLKNFTEYTLSYSGGNTLDDVKSRNAKRLRKRTRKSGVALATTTDNSDDEGSDDNEVVLYCICNKPSFGEMVACDAPDCQAGEWFHVGCVGLKEGEMRVGNWFCPECSQKNNIEGGVSRRRRATNAGKRIRKESTE